MSAPPPLARIEDASLNASAPPQQLWMDGWLLRFSPGKAKRARCIHALAAGCTPLHEKLARAQDYYRLAQLPLVLRLTPFSAPEGIDRALAELGLQAFGSTLVMAADLAADLPAQDSAPALPRQCALEPVTHADYADIVGHLRGSPAAQRRAHAERLAASPVPYCGWVLRQQGQVLACGQFAREAEYVGLYDIFTAPQARNRGLSRALCTALLRQAAAEGARWAYLQVEAENAPAQAVYRRLGFTEGYRYHYRAAEPGAA